MPRYKLGWMPWYTAHILVDLELPTARGRARRIGREVFLLVRGKTAAEAWSAAEELGRRYEGVELTASARTAIAHFAGVRQLTACARGAGDATSVEILGAGVELTSIDFELDDV